MIEDINPEQLDKLISENSIVVVHFYSAGAFACTLLDNTLEEIKDEYKDKITFVKLDYNKYYDFSRQIVVLATPTILIYKNNIVMEKLMGYMNTNQMKDVLKKFIN